MEEVTSLIDRLLGEDDQWAELFGRIVNGKIEGDVNLSFSMSVLTELPDLSGITVSGDFTCTHNKLTSLRGSPSRVGGSFDCDGNDLTSLEGAPTEVGGSFYCSVNKLTSLQGSPVSVGGHFFCQYNELTSLEGAPASVGGDLRCYSNSLTSLRGMPIVHGEVYCDSNPHFSDDDINQAKADNAKSAMSRLLSI